MDKIKHKLEGIPFNIEEIYEEITDETGIKSLIEFSRSIHAEMDAITTAARLGRGSTQDADLYCTTYPCHNCARHIVASGIKNVFYIEPYEKSLAYKLHDDSICSGLNEGNRQQSKLNILPFEGVAPRKYLQLFRFEDRKEMKKDQKSAAERSPLVEKIMDRYTDFETYVLDYLDQKMKTKSNDQQLQLPTD